MNDDDYRRKQEMDRHNAEQGARMRNLEYIPGTNEKNKAYVPPKYQTGGTGGQPTCFPKGTLISTPFGKVDVAEIVKYDLVTSICTRTGLPSTSKVLRVCQHSNKKLWLIKLSNETSIHTTGFHSFFNGREWKKASKIRPGDFILCRRASDGSTKLRMVAESNETGKVEDVYNIIVEKDFTFIANGALANSFTRFRAIRSILWSSYSLLHGFLNKIVLKIQDLSKGEIKCTTTQS